MLHPSAGRRLGIAESVAEVLDAVGADGNADRRELRLVHYHPYQEFAGSTKRLPTRSDLAPQLTMSRRRSHAVGGLLLAAMALAHTSIWRRCRRDQARGGYGAFDFSEVRAHA
jgi:hypothetical protein